MPTRRHILIAGLGCLTLTAVPAWVGLAGATPLPSSPDTERRGKGLRVVTVDGVIVLTGERR